MRGSWNTPPGQSKEWYFLFSPRWTVDQQPNAWECWEGRNKNETDGKQEADKDSVHALVKTQNSRWLLWCKTIPKYGGGGKKTKRKKRSGKNSLRCFCLCLRPYSPHQPSPSIFSSWHLFSLQKQKAVIFHVASPIHPSVCPGELAANSDGWMTHQ